MSLLLLKEILSLPKSIWFNFRCFPFKTAIKMPVLVAYNTKLKGLRKGCVRVPSNCYRFMIKLGFAGTPKVFTHKAKIILEKGNITFKGPAILMAGVVLSSNGELIIGSGTTCNSNVTIWCEKKIELGDDVMIGWNTFMYDSNGHYLWYNDIAVPKDGEIHVGNHVWIGAESRLAKGADIKSGSVLSQGSICNKAFDEENILLAGRPAKKIKENVKWER